MDIEDLFYRFGLALGIGLLVGLERGWRSRDDAAGSRTAGIRTFALTGLLGGVFGGLTLALGGADSTAGGVVLGFGFAAYAAAFTLFCRDENVADKTFSATTAIAGMTTFTLGAYALLGEQTVAAAGGVATALLLAAREQLHGWVARLTWPELRSVLVLLAMTFVAMPLMPDRPVEALAGLNPRKIWSVAVVLAGVSFLGYVAVKVLGARLGVLLAAAAGGLVSSTAVMVTNARRAAAHPEAARVLAGGAMLATAVSLLRTVGLVAALNSALLVGTAVPLLVAAAVAIVAALVLAKVEPAAGEQGAIELSNPFEIKSVFSFALLLGVISVVAKVLSERYGAAGALLAAVATGLADVDAVTVSISRLAPQTLSLETASLAILAAVASNTVSKLFIGIAGGPRRFGVAVAVVSGLATAAAAAAFWLVGSFGLAG